MVSPPWTFPSHSLKPHNECFFFIFRRIGRKHCKQVCFSISNLTTLQLDRYWKIINANLIQDIFLRMHVDCLCVCSRVDSVNSTLSIRVLIYIKYQSKSPWRNLRCTVINLLGKILHKYLCCMERHHAIYDGEIFFDRMDQQEHKALCGSIDETKRN